MSYSEHVDVLSQVARGFANNSKCTKGKTHLVELGAMPAIMHLASKKALTTVRKHAMLALCQIASCRACLPENLPPKPCSIACQVHADAIAQNTVQT